MSSSLSWMEIKCTKGTVPRQEQKVSYLELRERGRKKVQFCQNCMSFTRKILERKYIIGEKRSRKFS